jgi:drug/metabolite transporter (DMT)-like permease
MYWITLSLAAALLQASRNTVMKRLGHELDEYINVLGRFFFLLPFAGVAVLINGVPEVHPDFYWACVFFGLSQTAATLCLSKALLYGDISVVIPLWRTSLIWLVVVSYFTLGEAPSAAGLAGIGVTLIGVYVLNISRARISPWEPIRVLFTDRGQRFALLSALMYAPSVVTFKWAIVNSSVSFATFWTYVAATLCVLPFALKNSRQHFSKIPRLWKSFLSLGLFAALTNFTQGEAYRIQLSSYVEAVKQTEILFALLIGYVLFGERERMREISIGAAVILAGVVVLVLFVK